MKIATLVRTYKDLEEKHIERFLETHAPFSDIILIGTCDTSPKTLEIINRYANVKTREFNEVIELPNGIQVAHESLYYAMLMEFALDEGIDWGIWDDCDHAPNFRLQRDARHILESNKTPFTFNLLLYYWGTQLYFPKLNDHANNERLWAWNVHDWMPQLNIVPNTIEIVNQPSQSEGLVLSHPPYCVKHFSYLTEEDTRKKMAFNHARGVPQDYPLESCGIALPIPDWVDQE